MIADNMMPYVRNNNAIRELFEEGKRRADLYGAENVFDFSIGNPSVPAPDAVRESIIDILDTEESGDIHGYMSNAGYPYVRKQIADSLNRRFGTAFDENNILMTVGAGGGLNVVLKTLLNPGEQVAAFLPYFSEYERYVANWGATMLEVPANLPTFQPDTEKLAEMITPKTRVVIINSPNNPTGVIYTEESIKKLAAVLEAKEKEFDTEIFLVTDEPYRELAFDGAQVPFVTKYYHNAIVCYSFSKSLSLPGERIGYIVVPSEVDDADLVYLGMTIATRIIGFINAPSLFQQVVGRCCDEKSDIDFYDRNRKALYDGLVACGYDCVKPDGAFYLWVKSPTPDENEFLAAAKEYNLLITPGSFFKCPGYMRISYCVPPERIESAMPKFKELADKFIG